MQRAADLKTTSNNCPNKRNLRNPRRESPKLPLLSSQSQRRVIKTWLEHTAEWRREKSEGQVLNMIKNDLLIVKSSELRPQMNLECVPNQLNWLARWDQVLTLMFLLVTAEMLENLSPVFRSFWVTLLKIETPQIQDLRNQFKTEAEGDTPKLKRTRRA